MTLASSGTMSIGGSTATRSINLELGLSASTSSSLGQTSFRTLAGVPSGAISMSNFYGKSNRVAISYTFASSTANASLNVAAIGGYVAGKSDITVTVNPSVYLYSTSTGTPGLTLSGGSSGDTLTLVNNGFIMGQGGIGTINTNGSPGGTALQLGYPTTVNNTNGAAYIGGGGGGGGATGSYGGGGAGGGPGAGPIGGAGGGIGSSGANALDPTGSNTYGRGGGAGGGGGGVSPVPRSIPVYGQGGGGGRIFPGVGGAGGPGGSAIGGNGGSANSPGGSNSGGGGGGGWGASGGNTTPASPTYPGGSGGKAVNLNGKSITWVSGNTTRVYGSVS